MNKKEAAERIAQLTSMIEEHNYKYYVLSQPSISDYEFDMLLEELIKLEKEHDYWQTLFNEQAKENVELVKAMAKLREEYGITVKKEFKEPMRFSLLEVD